MHLHSLFQWTDGWRCKEPFHDVGFQGMPGTKSLIFTTLYNTRHTCASEKSGNIIREELNKIGLPDCKRGIFKSIFKVRNTEQWFFDWCWLKPWRYSQCLHCGHLWIGANQLRKLHWWIDCIPPQMGSIYLPWISAFNINNIYVIKGIIWHGAGEFAY